MSLIIKRRNSRIPSSTQILFKSRIFGLQHLFAVKAANCLNQRRPPDPRLLNPLDVGVCFAGSWSREKPARLPRNDRQQIVEVVGDPPPRRPTASIFATAEACVSKRLSLGIIHNDAFHHRGWESLLAR